MFNITSEYRRFKARGKRTKNVAHNYYNLIPYHQEMIGKEIAICSGAILSTPVAVW